MYLAMNREVLWVKMFRQGFFQKEFNRDYEAIKWETNLLETFPPARFVVPGSIVYEARL
jgi:hypothetical protein